MPGDFGRFLIHSEISFLRLSVRSELFLRFAGSRLDGVTTFRMPQIVLNPTEIAPVHGPDYRPNNKPVCP
jgi:hypothetical protein